MLKNEFYTVDHLQQSENTARAGLKLNAAHPVFEGHFPGQPVVPGVCMLEIVKEMLTDIIGKKLVLRRADHLKFLMVIDPRKTPAIELDLKFKEVDNKSILADARLFNEEVIYFKCKVEFIKQD